MTACADRSKKRYRWKRTRHSHNRKQDPGQKARKQADLETLVPAAEGLVDIKYLDEAGFCLWSPVSYRYSPIGEQKRMEQTPTRYGRRISILGLWPPGEGFEYALSQGGFKGQSYIKVMDWVAQKASQTLAQTGHITVVTGRFTPVVWCNSSGLGGRSRDSSSSFYRPIVQR